MELLGETGLWGKRAGKGRDQEIRIKKKVSERIREENDTGMHLPRQPWTRDGHEEEVVSRSHGTFPPFTLRGSTLKRTPWAEARVAMRAGEREGGMEPPKLVIGKERRGHLSSGNVATAALGWWAIPGGGVYTWGYTKRQLCVGIVSVYNHEKTLPNSKNIGPPANSPIIHKALTLNWINNDFFHREFFHWRKSQIVGIFHHCKISNKSVLQNNRSLNLSGGKKSWFF